MTDKPDLSKQAKYPSAVAMHGEGDKVKGMTITTPAEGDSRYVTTIADMASACRMVACLHSLLCEKDDLIAALKSHPKNLIVVCGNCNHEWMQEIPSDDG